MNNLKAQVRELKSFKQPSMLYKSFVGEKAKCNQGYKLGIPDDIKNSIMIGWATQLDFEYDAKRYFSDKNCRKHHCSIKPEPIYGKYPKIHASYKLNHCVVCAFRKIGCGPMHIEQVAAWLDYLWKAMGHCWKKTKAVFGEIVTEVAKVFIKAAQE
eukprot:6899735-Ditylum_brightwellii.AAC.1